MQAQSAATKRESLSEGRRPGLLARLLLSWVLALASWVAWGDSEYPELDEVRHITQGARPPGVVFLIMEEDETAYEWVVPRLLRYVALLREPWPDLPIAVISHGEEMFALLASNADVYASFHAAIRSLVTEQGVDFQLCGAYARDAGVDESEFVDFVEVVPSAPAQITDYRMLDYRVISLEPTW
ncbi:MAG: hypothetical protein ABFS23_07790 [Pseudomonadota bacterium]